MDEKDEAIYCGASEIHMVADQCAAGVLLNAVSRFMKQMLPVLCSGSETP